jgi:hypothetical protein
MQVKQIMGRNAADVSNQLNGLESIAPDLLLVFASVDHFTGSGLHHALRQAFPNAALLGCTTAGEITPDGVDDGTCTVTGVQLDHTRLTQGDTELRGMDDSFAAGERIGQQIAAVDLKAVLVFGPGVQINGSALVNGMTSVIGTAIPITGGLAGDGGAFKQTFTLGPGSFHSNSMADPNMPLKLTRQNNR